MKFVFPDTRFCEFVDKDQEDAVKVVETLFRTPVSVCLQNGLEHTFQSVEDALDFLENEWATRHGTHHQRAVDLCRAALNRVTASETAREAFIAACIEGGIRLVQAPLGHSVRHVDTRPAM